MFVQSVLRLVGFSNTVAGAETRAFNVQVPPPSSLRTIPIVELLGPLKPGQAYTPLAIQLVPPSQAIDQVPSRDVVYGADLGRVAMVNVAPPSVVTKSPASVVKKTWLASLGSAVTSRTCCAKTVTLSAGCTAVRICAVVQVVPPSTLFAHPPNCWSEASPSPT